MIDKSISQINIDIIYIFNYFVKYATGSYDNIWIK